MDTPLKNFKEQGGTNKPRGTLLSSRPHLCTLGARSCGFGTMLLYLLQRQSLQQVTLQVSHPCISQGFFLQMWTRFTGATEHSPCSFTPRILQASRKHAAVDGMDVRAGKPQTPVTLPAPNTAEVTNCSLTVEEICHFLYSLQRTNKRLPVVTRTPQIKQGT